MDFNSAFNLLRPIRSVFFVVPVNEQALDTKRSYAKSGTFVQMIKTLNISFWYLLEA